MYVFSIRRENVPPSPSPASYLRDGCRNSESSGAGKTDGWNGPVHVESGNILEEVLSSQGWEASCAGKFLGRALGGREGSEKAVSLAIEEMERRQMRLMTGREWKEVSSGLRVGPSQMRGELSLWTLIDKCTYIWILVPSSACMPMGWVAQTLWALLVFKMGK